MIDRNRFHLIHGGHRGTEAEFGRAAEKWGVTETTISFEGHRMERAVNVETLTDEQLGQGNVSMEFVFQTIGREFHRGHGIRRVIQSMFQLVVRSQALFAVGWIQPDDTVKGGTGWGVELAKLFNREVHVFDQGTDKWFLWEDHAWKEADARLPEGTFSATGTRNLTPAGIQAISDLFEQSLGPA